MNAAAAVRLAVPLDPPYAATRAGRPISFINLTKAYGDRTVLQNVDLHIEAGQLVAIVGRSGGGKTTLLRLIAGLEAPSEGHVVIGDTPVTTLQSSVRFMFQDARLLPWQRVLGNVGISRGDLWRKRALDALAGVGLSERAHEWPAVLSGGQKQRVALARALVHRPGVLLLDEPFGALDALTRMEMHALLARVWAEHGFTGVLITHDVGEAVTLADRVLVLRDGHFVLDLYIDLPRPRREVGDARASALQARILKEV